MMVQRASRRMNIYEFLNAWKMLDEIYLPCSNKYCIATVIIVLVYLLECNIIEYFCCYIFLTILLNNVPDLFNSPLFLEDFRWFDLFIIRKWDRLLLVNTRSK